MKGYQISLLAEQERRIEHKPAMEWLLKLAKELGISGARCSQASRVLCRWSSALRAVF